MNKLITSFIGCKVSTENSRFVEIFNSLAAYRQLTAPINMKLSHVIIASRQNGNIEAGEILKVP